jgi:hypothetical protein
MASSEGPGLIVNGGQSSKSPAAMLSEQHEKHNVTIEDVVDEEDIKHPPPSSAVIPTISQSSDVAPTPKKAPVFDVQSEELFPALGGGPKSKAAANVPAAWGAKKPGVTAAAPNGSAAASQPSGMYFFPLRYYRTSNKNLT